MKTIALTGGIGTGKSTIAKIFSKLGVPIILADQIALEITTYGKPCYKKILAYFGESILEDNTKEINRKKLRDLIFNKPEKKIWLENLLHPVISEEIRNNIINLSNDKKYRYCIVEIPLLFELGLEKYFDRVLLIDCEQKLQEKRIQERNNTSIESIMAIINSQLTQDKKRKLADDIITNDKDLNYLSEQVNKLHLIYAKN